MNTQPHSAGTLIREWRTRRRMSQLDLAAEAAISQRHLSFVESGRTAPSREMVLHLSEQLDIPLRQRNRILLAAGYAPIFSERKLDDPTLAPAMTAVEMVLKGHEPFPAIAVDHHWNLVAANSAIGPLLEDVADASLLAPPINVLRLSLHPQGLAPRIVNLHEWRTHLIERLRRQIDASGDTVLADLERELLSYPGAVPTSRMTHPDIAAIAHPLRLKMGKEILSFIGTITVFGTPLDVTLSELAIESFFPADPETALLLQGMAAKQQN
ncbi:transcriptional regulator with XRE-family HTH domain [Pseudaminobacter salicylatoxidans]|uniref:Transcriptional regulator with XRE-family HTH domain n=1 Tax=Pseudaminobacter salicylatoxidans TaxID=93369 RepID=A0A316C6H7_PSESE|nr:helix-turn-helix transcriptional regulator [Pseudaminobacter salicylatoxidans]PWJ85299.1 transcriptional regulator with XRE-family HTH domain [Pseudaminobacter salicylatoxidans]